MRARVYSYRCLTSWFDVLSSRVNVRKRVARPVMIGVMVNSGCRLREVAVLQIPGIDLGVKVEPGLVVPIFGAVVGEEMLQAA